MLKVSCLRRSRSHCSRSCQTRIPSSSSSISTCCYSGTKILMIFWYSIASRRTTAMEDKHDEIRKVELNDEPPRSRLYSLVPEGIGTPLIESLTSYINRLAWSYRVSPRILVAQEII